MFRANAVIGINLGEIRRPTVHEHRTMVTKERISRDMLHGMTKALTDVLGDTMGKQVAFAQCRSSLVDERDCVPGDVLAEYRLVLEPEDDEVTMETMEYHFKSSKSIAVSNGDFGDGWSPSEWRAMHLETDDVSTRRKAAVTAKMKAIVVDVNRMHKANHDNEEMEYDQMVMWVQGCALQAAENAIIADVDAISFDGRESFAFVGRGAGAAAAAGAAGPG